jgi:hypothetical protein
VVRKPKRQKCVEVILLERLVELTEELVIIETKIMATQKDQIVVAQAQLAAVQSIGVQIDTLLASGGGDTADPGLVTAMQATSDGIAAVASKLPPPTPAPTV